VAQTLEATMQGMPETALRLTGEGHTESVSVQRLQPGDRVRVPLGQAFPAGTPAAQRMLRISATAQADGRVGIAVADTGCGIPGTVAENRHELFFTTRE
jgi:Cu2+-exporting ATPase